MFKLLITSDLHGKVPIIERDENTLILDNGDFLLGTPQSVYGLTHFKQSPLLKQLDIDVMTVGNHDFDYGLKTLTTNIDLSKVVCCNLADLEDNLLFQPYLIKEINNVKLGIIGAMTTALPQLQQYEKLKNIKTLDAIQHIKQSVFSIRSRVDYIIVLYHGGIEIDLVSHKVMSYQTKEDEAVSIAKEIDGIDIIVCGHQHRQNCGMVNNTLVVQPYNEVIQIEHKEKEFNISNYPLIEKDIILDGYEEWLNKEVDLEQFKDFVRNRLKVDEVILESDPTRKSLFENLISPYQFLVYEMSEDEANKYLKTNHDPIRIASNKPLLEYRIVEKPIINFFNEYHNSQDFLSKK